jgi:5'-nucleotidase (lipoprotein e(P4) family)
MVRFPFRERDLMGFRRLVPALCGLVLLSCTARDTHERLNGLLWMQTSAEYEALTAVTFRQATSRVLELNKQVDSRRRIASAALEQPGENTTRLPPAVIVDIDETLLDNSPMSGELIERRVGWDDRVWTDWVERRQAEYIRGADAFVEAVRAAGIEVFFVTNRKVSEQSCTIEDMLPIVVTDAQLLASGETDPVTGEVWVNEKTARRAAIARTHWILALVGDDLADFIPGVREGVTPEGRRAAMERNLDRFGDRWFLLPNPVYGSWEFAIVDTRDKDGSQLGDKHRKLQRFPQGKRELRPCETPDRKLPPGTTSSPAS